MSIEVFCNYSFKPNHLTKRSLILMPWTENKYGFLILSEKLYYIYTVLTRIYNPMFFFFFFFFFFFVFFFLFFFTF